MGKTNWKRVLLGGLVAGIVINVLSVISVELFFKKMVEKQGQIFHALSKRGDVEMMIAESVIQILAEPPVGLEHAQILIRGNNHSRIRSLGQIRPKGKVLSVLQEAEKFHL